MNKNKKDVGVVSLTDEAQGNQELSEPSNHISRNHFASSFGSVVPLKFVWILARRWLKSQKLLAIVEDQVRMCS